MISGRRLEKPSNHELLKTLHNGVGSFVTNGITQVFNTTVYELMTRSLNFSTQRRFQQRLSMYNAPVHTDQVMLATPVAKASRSPVQACAFWTPPQAIHWETFFGLRPVCRPALIFTE